MSSNFLELDQVSNASSIAPSLPRVFHHVIAACNSLEKKLFAPLTDHSMPWGCCPQSEENRLLPGSISTSALSIFIAVLLLCASIPAGLVKS